MPRTRTSSRCKKRRACSSLVLSKIKPRTTSTRRTRYPLDKCEDLVFDDPNIQEKLFYFHRRKRDSDLQYFQRKKRWLRNATQFMYGLL